MKQNKVVRSLANNWQAKILALVLAVSFYLVVEYATLGQRIVRIPLQAVYPGMLIPASTVPESVELTLSGDDRTLYMIDPAKYTAKIDFSAFRQEGVAESLVILHIADDSLLPADIGVSVRPKQVKVFLELVDQAMPEETQEPTGNKGN